MAQPSVITLLIINSRCQQICAQWICTVDMRTVDRHRFPEGEPRFGPPVGVKRVCWHPYAGVAPRTYENVQKSVRRRAEFLSAVVTVSTSAQGVAPRTNVDVQQYAAQVCLKRRNCEHYKRVANPPALSLRRDEICTCTRLLTWQERQGEVEGKPLHQDCGP
jgi:hypothetical protein